MWQWIECFESVISSSTEDKFKFPHTKKDCLQAIQPKLIHTFFPILFFLCVGGWGGNVCVCLCLHARRYVWTWAYGNPRLILGNLLWWCLHFILWDSVSQSNPELFLTGGLASQLVLRKLSLPKLKSQTGHCRPPAAACRISTWRSPALCSDFGFILLFQRRRAHRMHLDMLSLRLSRDSHWGGPFQ